MDLDEFSRTGQRPLPLASLAADKELARDIQGRLGVLGLLDPYVDGKFGPVSTWALGAFADRASINFRFELSPELARVLLQTGVQETFPLLPGNGLTARVIGALQRRGYWIARGPGTANIVYVEGLDVDSLDFAGAKLVPLAEVQYRLNGRLRMNLGVISLKNRPFDAV